MVHTPKRELLRRTLQVLAIAVGCCVVSTVDAADNGGPFQTTGIKIGEVTDTSAIVWSRLTLRESRNPSDGPMVRIEYEPAANAGRRERAVRGVVFPAGATVGDLREAVPGADGDVRISFKAQDAADWRTTEWQSVDPLGDFTTQFALDGLQPATNYQVRVESRGTGGAPGITIDGRFRTAPRADDPRRVVFTAATCFGNDDQDSPGGFKIYGSMLALDPDFFVHLGDIIYYDELAKTAELARYHWQRMYGWPGTVAFHRQVASFFVKDDHDTLRNDCWPTMKTPYMHEFTFRQGQAIFREQTPMGRLTYRTQRFGKDLQIWLVEGRDFRMPNDMPDGPEKTIWGAAQKQWFKETVAASDATFRILFTPTPLVGPDREQKRDNHANSGFRHDGNELRKFLADQSNVVSICGDRHWQYASMDPATRLREYSVGPASDEHAGGWEQEDYRPDFHRFLRVAGGFLSGTVQRTPAGPTLTLRHHDVDGVVTFEDRLTAAAP
ncbi:MAG: alkaline phosphatase D family protein [Pirellulales bacterium]